MVFEDISFNIVVLSFGIMVYLGVEDFKFCICLVVVGKVKVKIGIMEFKIGLYGMFKVMLGEICVVENWYYVDVYIYCMMVDNYEFVV